MDPNFESFHSPPCSPYVNADNHLATPKPGSRGPITAVLKTLRPIPKILHIVVSLLFFPLGILALLYGTYFLGESETGKGGLAFLAGPLEVTAGILGLVVGRNFHRTLIRTWLVVVATCVLFLYVVEIVIILKGVGLSGAPWWAWTAFLASVLTSVIIIGDLTLLLVPCFVEKVEQVLPNNPC